MLAVLWDVDGTLADSEPLHRFSMVAAMADFGITARESDEMIGVSRRGVHERLSQVYPGVPGYDVYTAAVDSQFFSNIHMLGAMDASVDACTRYAEQGRTQVAVSNSEPQIVEKTLEAIGIIDLFAAIVACDGKGEPKPHPDPYLRALRHAGVDHKGAIAIEDTMVGCDSARRAGLYVVGLPEDPVDIGANVHYRSMPRLDPEEIVDGGG